MPSSATAKTKSARRFSRGGWQAGFGLPLCLFVGAVVALMLSVMLAPQYSVVRVRVGSRAFTLQVASSDAAREKGLSRRASLAAASGMLFVYPNSGVRCFWMKDMHFPLDMIWLSAGKQVVYIQPNVSPSTYPRQFCPNQPARYVIELHAGASASAHMWVGQLLRF